MSAAFPSSLCGVRVLGPPDSPGTKSMLLISNRLPSSTVPLCRRQTTLCGSFVDFQKIYCTQDLLYQNGLRMPLIRIPLSSQESIVFDHSALRADRRCAARGHQTLYFKSRVSEQQMCTLMIKKIPCLLDNLGVAETAGMYLCLCFKIELWRSKFAYRFGSFSFKKMQVLLLSTYFVFFQGKFPLVVTVIAPGQHVRLSSSLVRQHLTDELCSGLFNNYGPLFPLFCFSCFSYQFSLRLCCVIYN